MAFSNSITLLGQRGGFRFGGGQLGFGLGDIEFIADAAFVAAADQLHLFLAQAHRAGHRGDFGVERAQGKIILRDIGLEGEQDIVIIRERCLGIGPGAFKSAPHAAPEVDLITQIQRRLMVLAVMLPKLGTSLGEYRWRSKLGSKTHEGSRSARATRAVARAWSTRATAALRS
jgi:hypothetical protein